MAKSRMMKIVATKFNVIIRNLAFTHGSIVMKTHTVKLATITNIMPNTLTIMITGVSTSSPDIQLLVKGLYPRILANMILKAT